MNVNVTFYNPIEKFNSNVNFKQIFWELKVNVIFFNIIEKVEKSEEKTKTGEIYGNYLIEKKMIETNSSILMAAKDNRDNTNKVLKFVKYKKMHADRYDNEVKVMDMFDHPNILKYEYSIFQNIFLKSLIQKV